MFLPRKVFFHNLVLSCGKSPPLLGEHTGQILQEVLGYSAEEVSELHEAGAVGQEDCTS